MYMFKLIVTWSTKNKKTLDIILKSSVVHLIDFFKYNKTTFPIFTLIFSN